MTSNSVDPGELITAIHDRGAPLVLAITGGGSGAISQLLAVPGASRTLLEAVVPYAGAALHDWLGVRPEQSCSARTARIMAMRAFERARQFAAAEQLSEPDAVAGIACTASLASDRPKRGEHRAHLALQTAARTVTCSLVLQRDRRSRAEEESLVARSILNLIAEHAGLDIRLAAGEQEDEPWERVETLAPDSWRALLLGQRNIVAANRAAEGAPIDVPGRVVFPGAFNPVHEGHRNMATMAASLLGRRCEFEISLENVDKPLLDYTELAQRVAQFAADDAVWFTRAAHFVTKSELFPAATFVVGIDTLRRIGDPRYCGSAELLEAQLREIARRGCSFLVFGRRQDGKFQGLDDLSLPPSLKELCREVPESLFREDVSSTEIRHRDGL